MRNRNAEIRRVSAASLKVNPRNWRTHGPFQRGAVQGLIREIGFAGSLIAVERDGDLVLLDGHLRQRLLGDDLVDVCVVDLDESEADELLALYDPLGGMAEIDPEALDPLVDQIGKVGRDLGDLIDKARLKAKPGSIGEVAERDPQLFVDCDDEATQEALFARLVGEGFNVRLSNF